MSRLSNRVKAIAVLVIVVTAVALGALLVLVAGPRLGLPALLAETPTATLVPGAEELGTQFLISKVGEAYFRAHYRFQKAEPTEWPGVVKFLYRYDYPPYVTDYQIFFLFDTRTSETWEEQGFAPHVLLEPQEFRVSREQAIEIAQAHGLQYPDEELFARAWLHSRYRGAKVKERFCWIISRWRDWDPPAPRITVVSIDVETGDTFVEESRSVYLEPPREPGIDWLLVGAGGFALLGLSLIAGIAWGLRRRKK